MRTLKSRRIVILLVVVLSEYSAYCQLFEGDDCYHEKKGVNGVCKLISNCPIAVKDIRQGIYPQTCGFQGSTVVACCPNDVPITTTSTTTTTTTTSKPLPQIPKGPLPAGQKSKKACEVYKKLAYKLELPPVLAGDNTGYEEVENCPWEPSALSVIIEGERTLKGEFPHMALIGYGSWPDRYAWKCGGSLVSDKFILTAAHCLYARGYGEPKFVRLGDDNYNSTSDDQDVQQINIKQLHKHPNYTYPEHYNDIALLELEKPANLNVYVKPVCLYTKSTIEPAGMITGWGNTEHGTQSENLLKAVVGEFSLDQCKLTFTTGRTLTRGLDGDIQICYGSRKDSRDTCQGDSGGPIQTYAKDVYCSYYLFGITSFGKGCGHQNIPGVYVRVSPYVGWIENIVWP